MSKKYDANWENSLTVVQEVQPPFIPDGAHAMTVVIDYPPGSAGAPPHRHPSGPGSATCWKARCCSNRKASHRA